MKISRIFWWRLSLSLLVGTLVTGISLNVTRLAAQDVAAPQSATQRRIINAGDALEDFKLIHGTYPTSLKQLSSTAMVPNQNGILLDGWRHPLQYTSNGKSYRLLSLGQDDTEGGSGLDCDLSNTALHPSEANLTFGAILFSPVTHGMVLAALCAGLLTIVVTFTVLEGIYFVSFTGWDIFHIGMTMMGMSAISTFVAFFLTMLAYPWRP